MFSNTLSKYWTSFSMPSNHLRIKSKLLNNFIFMASDVPFSAFWILTRSPRISDRGASACISFSESGAVTFSLSRARRPKSLILLPASLAVALIRAFSLGLTLMTIVSEQVGFLILFFFFAIALTCNDLLRLTARWIINASLRVFPVVLRYNQNWGTHFVIQKHFSKSTIKNRCFLCRKVLTSIFSSFLLFASLSPPYL